MERKKSLKTMWFYSNKSGGTGGFNWGTFPNFPKATIKKENKLFGMHSTYNFGTFHNWRLCR